MSRRVAREVADPALPRDPTVSVLMITYNHEAFIRDAIDSVLAQETVFDVELVIGEDCSTDGTRRIVEAYQRQHPNRIRLLLQPRNIGWRRNGIQTLQACRGKFVALLEGDDYWTDRQKLALQVALLEATPSAFICGARANVVPTDSSVAVQTTPEGDSDLLSTYGAQELFDGRWWFRTCTKMFPRHLLQSAPSRFSDGDWAETMWLIAKTNFGPVCFLDRVVGVYREHAGGVWSTLRRDQRVASDMRVLYDLVPVFQGAARAALIQQMADYATELVDSAEASAAERMICAWMATLRNPSAASWRRLARSLFMLGHGRRSSFTPDQSR